MVNGQPVPLDPGTSMKLDLPRHYNVSEVLFHNLDVGREGKTCLTVGGESMTYGELAGLAARVGNSLKALGAEPGARVLLLLLDGFEFPAAFFVPFERATYRFQSIPF